MTGLRGSYKVLISKALRILAVALSFLGGVTLSRANTAQLPARVLQEYALTSGGAREKYGDPRNWRLLGSADGGQTWKLLDTQTNQVFRARSQRKLYRVANREAFNAYRLEIDSSGAIQLAELEFKGPWVGVTNEDDVRIIASASKEHPLLGVASEAFDRDPNTRWIDFGTGQNAFWLQCQYAWESQTLVTNLGQLAVVARRIASHSPLGLNAAAILDRYTNRLSRPVRVLSGYALTSGNDMPNRDPRDWRLLGSRDQGATWHTLDVRRNEVFAQRFQRRVFFLTNEAPYSLYQIQIDSVRVPAGQPGGASSVQLAEIEPLYSTKDPGRNYSLLASAEAENPPVEAVEGAFDGKARTKWLSFTEDDNPNRSSWVRWEYLPGGDPPVINLRWLQALQNRRPEVVAVSLDCIVLFHDLTSKRLALLDSTGFQEFLVPSLDSNIVVGTQLHLAGRLELGSDLPIISDPSISSPTLLVGPEQVDAGQAATTGREFSLGQTEGTVASVSEDSSGQCMLGLAQDNGTGSLQVRLLTNPSSVHFFPGCRLRVSGVVQTVLNPDGSRCAGTIWVPDPAHLRFLDLAEKDWSAWRLYSLGTLASTNAAVISGEPVRVVGSIHQIILDGLILGDSTNAVRVYTSDTKGFAPGFRIEALGVFARENGRGTLRAANIRPAAPAHAEPVAVLPAKEPSSGTTEIRSVYERLEAQPGKSFPVTVRGVMTYIDLEFDSFYIQDGSAGITVVNQLDAGLAPLVKKDGSFVEVRGQVDPDLQAIVPEGFVTVLGKGRMPEPRRHSWDYLVTGHDDAQWVQVEGMVGACTDGGLTLIVAGGRLSIIVNDFQLGMQDRLLGSVVRVNGVCQPLRDNRNHRIGLQLLVPYTECIEVLRPAPEDPFDQTARKIAELEDQRSRGTNLTVRLAKTSGVVTYKESRLLFIQDGNEGLRVFLRGQAAVQIGDLVEAVGLVEPDGFSPKLSQAVVRKVGLEKLPPADALDLMGPDVTDHDALRVQLDGTLVGQKTGKFVQVLELSDPGGDKSFSAFIPVSADTLPKLPIGTRLKLTGIFKSEMESMADLGQLPTSFQLYLNSPRDIAVVMMPSWWNARHTLWVAAGLTTVLLLALTWASSLRKQVLQRTKQLHAEIVGHKQTEDALETSERFMRSLVQSLPQNIVRKDLQGRFTFANEFFCQTIGMPMNQVLGKTDFDLFSEELARKFQRDDQQVIATGEVVDTVEENRNADQETIYVQVIKSPLLDGENRVLGVQIIFWDVTARKRAEARVEEAQKAMVDASRQAGMAEVAAGVLHNVGNVLNSVNVSASLVSDRLHRSRVPGLAKAVALLREHETELPAFFSTDPRAKQITGYLAKLSECLAADQSDALREVETLKENIEHIKSIVAMQQSYAKIVGVTEKVKVTDLVEDALRLNLGTLSRQEVQLTREYDKELPEIVVERHKVLQILVNLIRNAKYACDESGRQDKRLKVSVRSAEGAIQIAASDNGVGIAPENLTRIFNHGFTTRKDGHGFGLHSGALAAKEMGGTLVAQSEGPGKGACFTLSLPLPPAAPR
jgi:PAS domain S-box-containing protein